MSVCLLMFCTVAAVGLNPQPAPIFPHWSYPVFGPKAVLYSANMVKDWSSELTAPPNEGCFVQSHIYLDSNNQIPARYSFQWRPQKGEAGVELIPAGERINSAFESKWFICGSSLRYLWSLRGEKSLCDNLGTSPLLLPDCCASIMAPSKHTQLVCICAGSSEVNARCDAIGGIIWLKDCLQARAEAVPDWKLRTRWL